MKDGEGFIFFYDLLENGIGSEDRLGGKARPG